MDYHPAVRAAIEDLRKVAPKLVEMLYFDHPFLLAALVSQLLPAVTQSKWIALIVAGGRIEAAKHALGVTLWLEQTIALAAVGPAFRCCPTSASFDTAIRAFVPPPAHIERQAAFLAIVSVALIRSTEQGGLVLAHAFKDAYVLPDSWNALISFILWASQNPTSPLAGLMRCPVPVGATIGAVAADTLGAWQFVVGYLLFGHVGSPIIFPRQRIGAYEIVQVTTAAQACALERTLGPVAYDIGADGHLGLETWGISVEDAATGTVIGAAEICLGDQGLRVRRIVTNASPGADDSVRTVMTDVILGAQSGIASRLPSGGLHPHPQRHVLQQRWLQLVGPYLAAHGIDPGLRRDLRHKDLALLVEIIDGLRGIATRFVS